MNHWFVTKFTWSTVLGGGLLVGMLVDRLVTPQPADAAAYHQVVRDAAAAMPTRIGNWSGTDVAVPPAVYALLRPNVMLSRKYLNVTNGSDVQSLLVQCSDARDMLAHYPPICYPSRGWVLSAAVPREWQVGDLAVQGIEYRFSMEGLDRAQTLVVDNFMVMPDGRFMRDMKAVEDAAADVRTRYFGAAQFQFVFSGNMDQAARDAALTTLLGGMRPALDAVRSGGAR